MHQPNCNSLDSSLSCSHMHIPIPFDVVLNTVRLYAYFFTLAVEDKCAIFSTFF